jgi:hypothetical protein
VDNSPNAATDPSGLFSPYEHYKLTYEALQAFGGRFSAQTKHRVIVQAVMADWNTQTVEYSHTHAMSFPNEHPWDAEKAVNSIIRNNLHRCTAEGLGWALHTVQDKYPRGHAGYREFNGFGDVSMFFHTWDDWFPSEARKAAALAATKKAIAEFLRFCPCQ